MNINFNVKDEIGVSFISASKWQLNNPELTDDAAVKKCLKRYMGSVIDIYNKDLAIGDDERNLTNLRSQSSTAQDQLMKAEISFMNKYQQYNSSVTPTDAEAT